MFNHHPQTLPVPFPFKGINTNTKDDISYGRFIQNILVSDNKTGALRYGTSLTASFPFDDAAYWREVIAVMPFLKDNGTSEKLVYVRYLDQSAITQDNIVIAEHPNLGGWCRATLTLANFQQEYRTFLRNSINDGIRIYFKQEIGVETEISVVTSTELQIVFDFPVLRANVTNPFQVYIERALIARVTANGAYEIITDQVDPLVIVSYVNFQGKLLIANGVDPVKVYDGTQLLPLKAPVPIPNLNPIVVANLNLTFSIPQIYLATLQADIKVGDGLTLVSDNENRAVSITNIVYNAPANNQVVMTITVNIAPQANVKKILYQKLCPSFSYLAVVHKRLWAAAEGRTYKDKFRPPLLAMKAYYAAKVESIYDWFNTQTNQIDFINLSNNSSAPDNLEAITMFEGRTLFLGRETTQVFIGEDPTTNNDGQNITLPDFQWEQTLPVGVVQQTLFVEVPNNLIFLSKYGIVSLTSASEYLQRKLQVSYQFSSPIDHYINSQLSFIETDRDFRSMRAFLYPYGRFLGFRIKYSCFIYQLNAEGAWVVFSENFAESSSILYDSTTQNLYLGMPQGELLVYSDKVGKQSYLEYGKGYMSWFIAYNWTFFENTWANTDVYIDSKTLDPLNVKVRIFTDQDETKSINEELTIDKQGILYDVSPFGLKPYPLNETSFTHEIVRFTADSLMIELSGTSNDLFVFNKLFLAGGAN
ncbi:tail tubular protein [Megaira polyxenophila phage MAnkyphage_25.80]|nr:tail tubular protein [Megaira polyxenophila phage MAnkyphage_25.80]